MSALMHLRRTQRTLRLAAALYALGLAAIVGSVAYLVTRVVLPEGGSLAWGTSLTAAAVAWWFEFARRGARALSLEQSAMWVEERVPGMQYALVSSLATPVPVAGLDRTIDEAAWRRVEQRALTQAAWRSALLLLAGFVAWWASSVAVGAAQRTGLLSGISASQRAGAGVPLRLQATVVPPAYSGLPRQALRDPTTIHALAGSQLVLEVSDSAAQIRLGDAAVSSVPSDGGRHAQLAVPPRTQVLTVVSARGNRVLVLDALPDSTPAVTLLQPLRDSVLRAPTGTIPLGATLHDDFGLASATFEYIVSSGDGESFSFRSGTLGDRRLAGARSAELTAALHLDAIQLKPGDIVHLRAVARDANDVTGPGVGRSETRTLRIARTGEYDSVAVEGAAPPEEDKSVLSQRMLINLTEALRKRRPSLARDALVLESAKLARDQGRLRRQVGDIVFDRLGDNPSGEHAHENDDRDRPLTKEELLKAAEEATKADSEVLDFANDETPVTAINRPLLEAYNAMWDAGRELGIAQPERALPHMYRALAAIQRARSAERLYLRGKAPKVVVDVARVRLQGKDKGLSSARTSRAPADSLQLVDRRRFARAVSVLVNSPATSIDSLLVLRVSLLERNAAASRALDAAIDALRSGRDATASLIQVRRALEGDRIVSDSVSRWREGGAR